MAIDNTAATATVNRLALFPDSTTVQNDSLTIAGHKLAALADKYDTPLYVYDRITMDGSVAQYQSSLKTHYPGQAEITYAGKAFLCKAIAEWTQLNNLWTDCTGKGEISIAVAGNVPREKILVHGVNKSRTDLDSALKYAGTIVVDNLTELQRIVILFSNTHFTNFQSTKSPFPEIWLRLQPGLAVATHHKHTQTGQHDSKFGLTAEEIIQAAQICRSKSIPIKGIHFHQGSNFRDPAPLVAAIQLTLGLIKVIGLSEAWHFCPGGGWSVAYHEDELPQPNIDAYVRVIAENIVKGCQSFGLSLPILHLEPGRSLVARAGVAIYRVGAVKHRGERIWLLIDGGVTDSPRHALYGSRYSCLTVSGIGRELHKRVSIAGPYCESGDVLIEDLLMPEVQEGELIAIPVSGAYHLSMSSNYNGASRPAVLLVEPGNVRQIVRRETVEELYQRDLSLT